MLLDGKSINEWSPVRRARRGLSRSFQSLELFEDSTVLDNLRVASDPRDLVSYLRDLVYPVQPELPSEVVAAVQEFDLEDELYREVQDLPYGKRRLLAIARAVATRPSVLLLDEPAAGLSDAETVGAGDAGQGAGPGLGYGRPAHRARHRFRHGRLRRNRGPRLRPQDRSRPAGRRPPGSRW